MTSEDRAETARYETASICTRDWGAVVHFQSAQPPSGQAKYQKGPEWLSRRWLSRGERCSAIEKTAGDVDAQPNWASEAAMPPAVVARGAGGYQVGALWSRSAVNAMGFQQAPRILTNDRIVVFVDDDWLSLLIFEPPR
jgi:hypothetical protein